MSICIYKQLVMVGLTVSIFFNTIFSYNSDDFSGHNVPILQVTATPGQGKGIEIALPKEFNLPINSQPLTKKLAETPEILLQDCETLQREWFHRKDEFDTNDLSCINFLWFQRACKQNPIGLLGECITPWCPTNRFKHPALRKKFENTITNEIVNYLQNNESVTITDFGSGCLFPILVVITKLNKKLTDLGWHKTIIINLIDTEYRDELLDELRNSHSGHVTADIFDYANEKRGYWLRYHVYQMVQFLMALQNQGGIRHKVRFYKSAQDYCTDLSSNQTLSSDFIFGIDILNDDESRLLIEDYLLLGRTALKRGGLECLLNGPHHHGFLSDGMIQKGFLHHSSVLKAITWVFTNPLKVVAGITTSIATGIWGYRRWRRSNA